MGGTVFVISQEGETLTQENFKHERTIPAFFKKVPLNPTPYTLHPTPCTLHPQPNTLHPTPSTLHPQPYTLHPQPSTQIGRAHV